MSSRQATRDAFGRVRSMVTKEKAMRERVLNGPSRESKIAECDQALGDLRSIGLEMGRLYDSDQLREAKLEVENIFSEWPLDHDQEIVIMSILNLLGDHMQIDQPQPQQAALLDGWGEEDRVSSGDYQ